METTEKESAGRGVRVPRLWGRDLRSILFPLLFLLLLGVSAELRWMNLDSGSMWFDEWDVIRVCQTPFFDGFFKAIRSHVLAYPGDYLIVKAFCLLPGNPDLMLRLPAFLFGLGAVTVAILLGGRLRGKAFGLCLGTLIAFSGLHIQYSQELRFYSSLFFFSLLAPFLAVWLLKKPDPRRLAIVTALTIIAYHFHVFLAMGVVLVYGVAAAIPLWQWWKKRQCGWYGIRSLAIATAAFLITCFPVTLYYVIERPLRPQGAMSVREIDQFWRICFHDYLGIERDSFIAFFTVPFSLSPDSLLEVVFYLGTMVLALTRRRIGLWFAVCGTGFVLAQFFLGKRVSMYLSPRHYLYFYPILLIVLATGICEAGNLAKAFFRKAWAKRGLSLGFFLPLCGLLVVGPLYAAGGIFYFRDHVRYALKSAREGDWADFAHNQRKAVEFALKNSTDEKVFFWANDPVITRALTVYLKKAGIPPGRFVSGKKETLLPELGKQKSFWYLAQAGNATQDILRKGCFQEFRVAGAQERLYFVRTDRLLEARDWKTLDWRFEDCGLLTSCCDLPRNSFSRADLLKLASQMLDYVPSMRLGSHREYVYDWFSGRLFTIYSSSNGKDKEELALAVRCVKASFEEGFELSHEILFRFMLICSDYGDVEMAYKCARRGIQLPEHSWGANYRDKMMAFMLQAAAQGGRLKKDRAFLERIQKKEPKGPVKKEMRRLLKDTPR